MPKQRDIVRMTVEEVDAFLHEPLTMSVATLMPDGRPHVVAMWYGFLDGAPAFETYRKSQKVLNVQRDPRITCLVEDGMKYEELRGVELVGTAAVVDDPEALRTVAKDLFARYNSHLPKDQEEVYIAALMHKRTVVRIDVTDVVSWDHNKLGLGPLG
jgi:PPOX class probable F420-dependent enzyme